ncbi:MAG: hypothetical protein EXS05_06420 [Planctomycetaceae bacterium]|nr:hypothetical protein [Planctomycetaceae bacterium]
MLRRTALAVVSLAIVWLFPVSANAQTPTEEQITKARLRGVEFLKQQQGSDGSWNFKGHPIGITALCTIALIENGVPVTDPVVRKGYEFVKKGTSKLKDTYDLALVTVMLSRIGDRRDKPLVRGLAARLIAGQMESGGWAYTCPGEELDSEKVLRDPSSLPKPKEGYGDNSCTQFAVLGLWVASRSGVNIDRTLTRVNKRLGKSQNDDGGWGYNDKSAGSAPSMTGACLFCLAVAEAAQIRAFLKSGKKPEEGDTPGKSLLEDKVFSKGLKQTGEFVKGVGPGSPRYFLWSVERIGVLLGLEKMGDVDWFGQGADGLLKTQKDEGNWPTAWADTDKEGLSDTCFALLFLRKANLGSDISRLLEGERDQKFEIVTRKPAEYFDTLDKAVAAAQSGETIRINGPGPYKVGHQELAKDITIQAGFGYAPILKFEIGKNRLGIRLKPETDPNGRDMFAVTGGNVALEGLRLQMEPPEIKPPVPWRAVTVKSGSLRLLNCTISEANRRGSTGVVVETAGRTIVRNCVFSGGKAAIELVTNGRQELTFDNSVAFSNAGIVVSQDSETKAPAEVALTMTNSVFQVKEAIVSPKLEGTLDVSSRLCVYQADWIGSNLLAGPSDKKGRSWKGEWNVYDVKQWVGSAGKPAAAGIKDIKGWIKLWGGAESNSYNRVTPFAGRKRMGDFSHDANPQDWQLDLGADADTLLQRARSGVDGFLAGPGAAFDQYRETIAYSDWIKRKLDSTLSLSSPPLRLQPVRR